MLLSLNDEFVRLGFDIGPGERRFTFTLLAVSPALPSSEFFLKPEVILQGAELGQGEPARCSGLISTLDLTKVVGQPELP